MQDIIINVLTTLVIVLVLAGIRKKVIKSENEFNAKKQKHKSLRNHYTIQYDRTLKVIMIIGLIFFFTLFLLSTLAYLNICVLVSGADLFTTIGYAFFVILGIVNCCGIVIWRITVDDNEILYRNYFGITKRYTFNDISEIKETKSYRLIAYSHGKRIFTIDDNVPGWEYFRYTAGIKGVPIIHEQQKKKI